MRVGGTEPIKVDVRLICATNRDLKKAVMAGTFREDLYYRLNVIQIQLPPLRERPGDVEDLVKHYVEVLGGPCKRVSAEAMAALVRYEWPGNVRELRNLVERMVVLSLRDELGVDDLPDEIRNCVSAADASPAVAIEGREATTLDELEKQLMENTLAKCGGNKRKAADAMGISRSSFYEKLKRYGIDG